MLDGAVDITFCIRTGMNGRYAGKNGKRGRESYFTKGTLSGAI